MIGGKAFEFIYCLFPIVVIFFFFCQYQTRLDLSACMDDWVREKFKVYSHTVSVGETGQLCLVVG